MLLRRYIRAAIRSVGQENRKPYKLRTESSPSSTPVPHLSVRCEYHRKMPRRFTAWLAFCCFLIPPARGFDTRWHSLCSQKVGEQFGFTDHAWKIMQFGNFSADFFGPVSEYASKGLTGREIGKAHV